MLRLRISLRGRAGAGRTGRGHDPGRRRRRAERQVLRGVREDLGREREQGSTPSPKDAAALASKFKAAAKQAPAKVKAAGNTITGVLSSIAHIRPSDAGDLANFYRSGDFKKYSKAVGTFFAYASTCTSS